MDSRIQRHSRACWVHVKDTDELQQRERNYLKEILQNFISPEVKLHCKPGEVFAF